MTPDETPRQGGPSSAPGRVAILAQFIARPGRADAVREGLLAMVDRIRGEGGTVSCDAHQLKNNPAAFYVLSGYPGDPPPATDRGAWFARVLPTGPLTEELVAPPMLTTARMLSTPDATSDRPRPVANASAQVTLVPFFTIRAGQVDPVRRAHLSMVEPTRGEPGCLDYDLYQALDDPTVMFFYENWRDQPALDQHMNTPNFYRAVRNDIDSRLVVPWTAHMMTMISQPTPPPPAR